MIRKMEFEPGKRTAIGICFTGEEKKKKKQLYIFPGSITELLRIQREHSITRIKMMAYLER